MIASLIAPNVGQESRGYVVGNMKKSYQINHNLKLHIFYCKSRWMIAKVWHDTHDTPNLVYTIITTYHNTLTAAGYEQSTEYNCIYAFDIYAILMLQISEGDINLAFVIVLSKDWHMCTPHIHI